MQLHKQLAGPGGNADFGSFTADLPPEPAMNTDGAQSTPACAHTARLQKSCRNLEVTWNQARASRPWLEDTPAEGEDATDAGYLRNLRVEEQLQEPCGHFAQRHDDEGGDAGQYEERPETQEIVMFQPMRKKTRSVAIHNYNKQSNLMAPVPIR